jgi:hypothetical protein
VKVLECRPVSGSVGTRVPRTKDGSEAQEAKALSCSKPPMDATAGVGSDRRSSICGALDALTERAGVLVESVVFTNSSARLRSAILFTQTGATTDKGSSETRASDGITGCVTEERKVVAEAFVVVESLLTPLYEIVSARTGSAAIRTAAPKINAGVNFI